MMEKNDQKSEAKKQGHAKYELPQFLLDDRHDLLLSQIAVWFPKHLFLTSVLASSQTGAGPRTALRAVLRSVVAFLLSRHLLMSIVRSAAPV